MFEQIITTIENITTEQIVYFYNTTIGQHGAFPRASEMWELEDDAPELKAPIGVNYYMWINGNIRFMTDTQIRNMMLQLITQENLTIICDTAHNGENWIKEVWEVTTNPEYF